MIFNQIDTNARKYISRGKPAVEGIKTTFFASNDVTHNSYSLYCLAWFVNKLILSQDREKKRQDSLDRRNSRDFCGKRDSCEEIRNTIRKFKNGILRNLRFYSFRG